MIVVAAGKDLPFVPRQVVCVSDMPEGAHRGGHAHRSVKQFIVCLRGSIELTIDGGGQRECVRLADKESGCYVGAMQWLDLRALEPDTSFLLLMSEVYDEREYVRDYAEFQALIADVAGERK
jgi:dTDP-4-dehydrorhamnose 3,5-epimerase-like enzyme